MKYLLLTIFLMGCLPRTVQVLSTPKYTIGQIVKANGFYSTADKIIIKDYRYAYENISDDTRIVYYGIRIYVGNDWVDTVLSEKELRP